MKAFLVLSLFALLASFFASAAIIEHSFTVKELNVTRLCNTQTITAVNGRVPGPTINVRENDTLIVHVYNGSPHNVTIHWHGIFQIRSQWADGPEYVTQCPIRPGHKYTYKFTILGQEGTLWWHAHSSFLRNYIHGALIIRPRLAYPFPKPYKEVPILLGEWFKTDVTEVYNLIKDTGGVGVAFDAFTINGFPGDFFNCSSNFKLTVEQGKTYMLRIVNTNLISQMFFKVASHKFTVVAVDASYTAPYITDVVVIAPGQTTDVLMKADQPLGSYYMAASMYVPIQAIVQENMTTRGIVFYEGAPKATTPLTPIMPAFNDTPTAHKFFSNLTGLVNGPHWVNCPNEVDEHMFITVALNLDFCAKNQTCLGLFGLRFSASMNNESFVIPNDKGSSMLEAFFNNKEGVYTRDFPDNPPQIFDFLSPNISFDFSKIFAPKSTKVKTLKFNSTVEIVIQDTHFIGIESHPMHIHGMNFQVLAQDFGVFDPIKDRSKFNLVNPQVRNTITVPPSGWTVIRFRATNPGIWLVHCHVEAHLLDGLAMAFEVENGPTPETTLPPPPPDFPVC